jgi:Zn-dependent peptidase ImmA (M78 family)
MKMKRTDPLPTNLAPDALLRSLGISEPRDIDVEAIAYYVGLKIKKRCLNCCEAMITGKGNKGIISVNPGGMPQRERFSIAHELGHWAHHRGETVACRSTDIGKFSKTNNVERAADQYAADLLMPWSMF